MVLHPLCTTSANVDFASESAEEYVLQWKGRLVLTTSPDYRDRGTGSGTVVGSGCQCGRSQVWCAPFSQRWLRRETDIPSDVFDNVNPDASDSEFLEMTHAVEPQTPGFAGSEVGDAPTPGGEGYEEGEGLEGSRREGEEEGEGEDGEEDIDEDLAAELDLALGDEDADDENDEDEEEEDDDESEEEDDDDDDEAVQAKKLLNEEIRDLEVAVAKKNMEIASSANPLIRVSVILFAQCSGRSCSLNATETIRGGVEETSGRSRHETNPARRAEGKATPAKGRQGSPRWRRGRRGRRRRRGRQCHAGRRPLRRVAGRRHGYKLGPQTMYNSIV